jgi:alanine racemase
VIELADLLEAMAPAGARLVGEPAATRFDGFAYDSRKLQPGEIFLAVRTARADGHQFIADAIRHGASGVIGDHLTDRACRGVTAVAVEDTLLALRAWARYVLARYCPEVIAVVGSVGKTTAAKAIVGVLGHGLPEDPAVFDSDNHNTLYGLPIALGQLAPTHGSAVLELAGDAPGDLRILGELTRPRIAVVTRSYRDPATQAELEDLIAGLPSSGVCVVNADDACLGTIAQRSPAPLLTCGLGPGADVRAEGVEIHLDHTCFRLILGNTETPIRLAGIGRPSVEGALAGAAVGLAQGFDPGEIAASLERLRPLPGRLNPLPGAKGSVILDDSFEAGPVALSAGLDVLARAPGKKIVLLGELAGSDSREATYRDAGEAIARRGDRLVTLGPVAEAAGLAALVSGAGPDAVMMTEGVVDAAAAASRGLAPGDAVLVVGGAEARLERVVERLLADPASAPDVLVRQDQGWKKRVFLSRERPTWVEVDLGAIGENVARLKALASPAALLAVLKADAYGHGALRVARTALHHGADYLATACLSEAVVLRRHGINAPILILGFTPAWQAQEIVRHHLTATVFSLEPVRYLSRAAQALGLGPARVHLKVDTGMGRLGLLPADVPAFVDAVRALPGVEIEGIFTHFAQADAADRAPTLAQIARFDASLRSRVKLGRHLRLPRGALHHGAHRDRHVRPGPLRCRALPARLPARSDLQDPRRPGEGASARQPDQLRRHVRDSAPVAHRRPASRLRRRLAPLAEELE